MRDENRLTIEIHMPAESAEMPHLKHQDRMGPLPLSPVAGVDLLQNLVYYG